MYIDASRISNPNNSISPVYKLKVWIIKILQKGFGNIKKKSLYILIIFCYWGILLNRSVILTHGMCPSLDSYLDS